MAKSPGAPKRCDSSLKKPAGGLRAAAVGDHHRRRVPLALLGEDVAPRLLGRAEHSDQKLAHVGVEPRLGRGSARRGAAAGQQAAGAAAELGQRAIADEQDHHSKDPEPAHHQRDEAAEHVPAASAEAAEPALAGPVFEIAALGFVAQPHHPPPALSRGNARPRAAVAFGVARRD
jgi:hypothetical protein